MKFLAFVVPCAVLGILLSFPDLAMTQDLGRHLKMGELITSCHCVPGTNLFSYTQPNYPFINHHWFSEVLLYVLYHTFALPSLMFFKVLGIMCAFLIVFWLAIRKSTVGIAGGLGVFFIYILSERFYTRPEVISFVLVAAFLYLIERYRQTESVKYLLVLPLLEILWVNAHIYFLVGVGLIGIVLVEQLVMKKKTTKYVAGIFVLSLGTLLINPHGISGALYPLHIFNNYGYSIVENQNIFFLNTFFFNPRILVFELVSITFILLALVIHKKHEFFWLIASSVCLIAGFVMIRNFSLFALTAFPYTAFMAKQLPTRLHKPFLQGLWVSALVLVCTVLWQRVSFPGGWFVYEPGAEKAVAFLKENAIQGPIFNNFDIGSYLIFSLYPQEKVFVDGRPEAYSVSFFNEYKRMQEDETFFIRQAEKYKLNTIVFAYTDITPWAQKFLGSITKNPEWSRIYLDQKIVVLVRNNDHNKALIKKYSQSL